MARGSARQRSPHVWELRWDGPKKDGKRNPQRETLQGTKKQAEARLNEIMADLQKTPAERASEMPVSECCRLFLKEHAGNDLRSGSVALYESFFRIHLMPVCGEMPLAMVIRHVVQEVIDKMVDRGLAASYPLRCGP